MIARIISSARDLDKKKKGDGAKFPTETWCDVAVTAVTGLEALPPI